MFDNAQIGKYCIALCMYYLISLNKILLCIKCIKYKQIEYFIICEADL